MMEEIFMSEREDYGGGDAVLLDLSRSERAHDL